MMFQITNPVLPFAGSGDGAEILGRIISAAVGFFIVIGFIMAFLYLVLGASNWITAAGDKTKLEKAQQQITQALIGLIILVSVFAIAKMLGEFTGIGFPNLTLPTVAP
jgi:uncharacterized MnhB-related membrane protein